MKKFVLCTVLCLFLSIALSVFVEAADPFEAQRNYLVKEYVEKEGITNKRVLQAMRQTLRHHFVPTGSIKQAYSDQALSIGHNQTISPPFIVAYMTQILDPKPSDRVLEIGTGSGYQAAVLSPLVKDVYTIEIVEPLGRRAKATLKRLRYKNVHCRTGDGYKGWPEEAPFDKIIVTCSPEKVPAPLVAQLKEGGKMIIPLGERYQQVFHLYEKRGGKLVIEKLEPTLFVPMTGRSEELRLVKPNPGNPRLVNGSFEMDQDKNGMFDGWHYQRQVRRIKSSEAPDAEHYIRFENQEAGKRAHIVQGLAIDGRLVPSILVSIQYQLTDWARGLNGIERPGVIIHYFDKNRKPLRSQYVGRWTRSNQWQEARNTSSVPANAREAIIQIGLNGTTGDLSIDAVSIRPSK